PRSVVASKWVRRLGGACGACGRRHGCGRCRSRAARTVWVAHREVGETAEPVTTIYRSIGWTWVRRLGGACGACGRRHGCGRGCRRGLWCLTAHSVRRAERMIRRAATVTRAAIRVVGRSLSGLTVTVY